MNLRGIANAASSQVNPNMPISYRRSTGYAIDPNSHKQLPTYSASVDGFGQLQPLMYNDLQQVDNLNMQGTMRALYVRGALAGIIRAEKCGGDLVTVRDWLTGNEHVWLVVKVLESFADWTKVAVVMQEDVAA